MKKITVNIDAKELREKMQIKDGKDGANGKDGKDAVVDPSSIALEAQKGAVEQLKTLIPIIPPPETTDSIADKLNEGEEIIEQKVIKGLEKRLDKIEKTSGERIISGGVIGRDLFKDIDISSQLDGVTKTFNIQAIWNIISVHLSSFPYALRKNIDFTYTPTSITFTSEITASSSLAAGQTCVLTVVQA